MILHLLLSFSDIRWACPCVHCEFSLKPPIHRGTLDLYSSLMVGEEHPKANKPSNKTDICTDRESCAECT